MFPESRLLGSGGCFKEINLASTGLRNRGKGMPVCVMCEAPLLCLKTKNEGVTVKISHTGMPFTGSLAKCFVMADKRKNKACMNSKFSAHVDW